MGNRLFTMPFRYNAFLSLIIIKALSKYHANNLKSFCILKRLSLSKEFRTVIAALFNRIRSIVFVKLISCPMLRDICVFVKREKCHFSLALNKICHPVSLCFEVTPHITFQPRDLGWKYFSAASVKRDKLPFKGIQKLVIDRGKRFKGEKVDAVGIQADHLG